MTHEENLFIVSLSEFLFEDVQDTREHSKDARLLMKLLVTVVY